MVIFWNSLLDKCENIKIVSSFLIIEEWLFKLLETIKYIYETK